MKKISILVLLFIFSVSICQAQRSYSKQNLQQASQEDLRLYLGKAKKQKKTGAILSIAGPLTAFGGLALGVAAWSGGTEAGWEMGVGMMLAGTLSTAIGIPILINGFYRVNKINKIQHAKPLGFKMNLSPFSYYNCTTQNLQSGAKLSIRF